MYAIASLLDPISDQGVRSLWERFEANCGLTGIQVTPLPHFSWQGADAYQEETMTEVLKEIARQITPFNVFAAGLGVFTGNQPVIYIPIVKDETLHDVHRLLWDRMGPFAVVPNRFYAPNRWVPHITLAYREVQPERLGCAITDMAFQRVEFTIPVDHFAVLYQTDGVAGVHSRFPFGIGT